MDTQSENIQVQTSRNHVYFLFNYGLLSCSLQIKKAPYVLGALFDFIYFLFYKKKSS